MTFEPTRLALAEVVGDQFSVAGALGTPSVVVITGSRAEWHAADPQAVHRATALTIGVCRDAADAADAAPPPALLACDLRARAGAASRRAEWNHAGTDGESLDRWLDAVLVGIEQSPDAALVAARLLRLGGDRRPGDGLVVEALAYSMLQSGPEHAAWLSQGGG